MSRRASNLVALLAVGAVALLSPGARAAAQSASPLRLDERCTVSVLNRSVRVNPDGSWVLPNVPANFGAVRARATCVIDGRTLSGESDPFVVPPNGVVNLPRIVFGRTTPIPQALTISAASTRLTQIGATVALTVMARYSDGTQKDVTAGSTGTQYGVSNAAIATVSANGLVQAVKAGAVVIQATHEGASSIASIQVVLAGVDTDGDGMPDEWELAHGLNPNDAIDAQEDPDRDGLTNLDEFRFGTDPRNADTDGDGLVDGREIAVGTSPLLRDTDGDGIGDGLEVQTGSNPLDSASTNLPEALQALAVTPTHFGMTFNSIAGDVSRQLAVIGTLRDGTTIDVTSTSRGTNYSSSDLTICNFGAIAGRVFAGLDGTCTITVTLGRFSATSNGTISTFSPVTLSFVSIPGFANNVDVNGSVVYVAAGGKGLQVVDVSNRMNPRLVTTAALDLAGNANDVKLSGTRAYVAAGSAGLHIVDISDPFAPRRLVTIDTPGDATDVRVYGHLAYVADGPGGLQIIDVTDGNARIIGSLATGTLAKGVDVSGRWAAVAAGGLQIVDVFDPLHPVRRGTAILPDEAKDVVVSGRIAYVADYTGSLQIVDFSAPTTPAVVASMTSNTDLSGYLMDVAFSAPFVLGADVKFFNGVPITDATTPSTPLSRTTLDFRNFRDDDGTGIAVDGNYVYLTTNRGIQENGAFGDGRLYIGQYRAVEDLAGVPPAVSITSPAAGATFIEGEAISVAVTAQDDVGVGSVNIMADGAVAFTDTVAPYQFNLTAPINATTLTVGATASDLGGNTGSAPTIHINLIPDPLTTVVGRVVDRSGQPLAGAQVSVLAQTAATGLDGTFTITGVPTLQPFLVVSTVFTRDTTVFTGVSAPTARVRGGTTEVGDIVAVETTFEANLGTLVSRCSHCDYDVMLPFALTINSVSSLRIHINDGYLRTDAGDRLNVFCCDLNDGSGGGVEASAVGGGVAAAAGDAGSGLYINDQLPGRFVVTWFKQSSGFGSPNTVQVILFADGRIQYGYNGVSPQAEVAVGLLPVSAPVSHAVDFSANTTVSVAAGEAVAEQFTTDGHPFDLDGGFIVFTPVTGGGYQLHPVPDVVPPSCVVTTPVAGSTLFEGEPISVQAVALDNGGIRRIHFQSSVGGLDGDDANAPFGMPFVVPVGVGAITFTATAYDSWNNAASCTATVAVVAGPPPALTVTSPTAVTAGATIPITVDASGNRVPVTRVQLVVNGAALSTDTTEPYEFLFTVPADVTSLAVSAAAVDTVGKTGTSPDVTVAVAADALTTVQGSVIDKANAPLAGAQVTASLHGATVEVFNFTNRLTALPSLDGKTPDRVKVISAINLRNPEGLFGADPFGFGDGVSHVMRITANLKTIEANTYTFTLGVTEGGQLFVNGKPTPVVNIPTSTGHFQEATGQIDIPSGSGSIAIQILTFDNGNGEAQLSYAAPGHELEVVPTDELTPTIVPYRATSDAAGVFAIPGVPTTLGALGMTASFVDAAGRTLRGKSDRVPPVAGGVTDVGVVKLVDFGALYGAAFSGPEGPASFYEIDPATGRATLIGPIGFWRVTAMDVSIDGTLYAVGRDPATRRNVLLTIDPRTGAGTAIGPTGVEFLGFGDTIADIAFRSDGVLFGYLEAGDGLGTINVATGAVTALGRTRVSCCGNGLAFAPDGRLLHANESELHVLNQTTGVATVLVPLTYPNIGSGDPRISSMKFQPTTTELFGFLKGGFGGGGQTFLARVDVTTGNVTIVGLPTIGGLDAIAWGPPR